MKSNPFSITGRVVILTGGGGAIGGHLASRLSDLGAIVYSIGMKFTDLKAKKTSNLIQKKCDITNTTDFENLCADIIKRHGKIDAFINNAGMTYAKKSEEEYPLEKWNEAIKINLTAPFACSQIVFKFMAKKKKGSIVNITSIGAERGFPNNPAYGATKGGLKVLTKCFARDWGKLGIRVNNVTPGYMSVGMTAKSYQEKKTRAARAAQTMLGMWGSPEDLVGPVAFLISDASSYMTGTDLYVDGGWLSNGLVQQ